MTSRSSSSNPVVAWMKQLVKRNYAIPVIALAGYLLIVELMFMTNINKDIFNVWMIKNLMAGHSVLIFFGSIAFGVILSAAFLHDLHDSASATFTHALPITRWQMMLSVTITGICMIALVQGIVTVVMFATCSIVIGMFPHHAMIREMTELLNLSHCLLWLRCSFLTALFAFALAEVCGVIAGQRVVHLLLTAYLMILPLCMWLLRVYYMGVTFYGASYGNDTHILRHVPLYSLYLTAFEMKDMMIQIISIIVLLALAFVIYRCVKLERVPSATLFPLFTDFLCFSLTFIGMTFVLVLAGAMDYQEALNNNLVLCFISLVSSAIIFLICRMIATSSLNVFNTLTLKKYLVYVMMTAVVFAMTFFNVFGLGKNVPKPETVTSVDISTDLGNARINDPDVITEITALHKELAAIGEKNDTTMSVDLTYHMKNGRELNRAYTFNLDNLPSPKHLEAIYRSDDFFNSCFPTYDKIRTITLNKVYVDDDGAMNEEISVAKTDLPALYEALRADMKTLQASRLPIEDVKWSLEFTTDDEVFRSWNITNQYTHTMVLIKEKGYDKKQ